MANDLPPESNIPNPWQEADRRASLAEPRHYGRVAGIILASILVLAGGVAAYFKLTATPPPLVQLEISPPGKIIIGQPFQLAVSVNNLSSKSITGIRLSLSLEDGLDFTDQPATQRFLELKLNDVAANSISRETFNLVGTSESDGLIRHLSSSVTYGLDQKSSAEYQKKSSIDLNFEKSPLSLSLSAPANVIPGEDFTLKFTYQNNGTAPADNLSLKTVYPPIFKFSTSSLATAGDNNTWLIPSVPPGGTGEINITGSVNATSGAQLNFSGNLSSQINTRSYAVSSQNTSVDVQTSPLLLSVSLNGDTPGKPYVASLGQILSYAVTYKNSSSVNLSNVILTANFSGMLFDFRHSNSSGSFDSTKNQFRWNSINIPAFANLAPGATGKVTVNIPLLNNYPPETDPSDNNKINASFHIESPTLPPDTALSKTSATLNLEHKVAGQLFFKASGFWRDAESKILNSGPFPPRVNVPTNYTVHWILKASASAYDNLKVSARIQPGVDFTGTVKSTTDSKPTYDKATGKISWQVSHLPAGSSAEAVFQISFTPAVNQVGNWVSLVGESSCQATDAFTGLDVNYSSSDINTNLPDDTTISGGRWVVE